MKTDAQIAKSLGISKGYFSKGYAWARKQMRKRFQETKETVPSSAHLPTPAPSTKLKLRLHRLQRSYQILNAVSEQKLSALKKNLLNNNHQWIGKGFRITTRNLQLEGIELWSNRDTPIAILQGVGETLADSIARNLALEYGFTIELEGKTPVGLTEIELTEHALAEHEQNKGIIGLHWTEGLMDVWMDKSFGLGGLESNRIEYIQKLTDFTNYIVEDKWTAKDQLAINAQVQAILMQQNQFFIKHNQLIADVDRLVRKLDIRLSQKKLGEYL